MCPSVQTHLQERAKLCTETHKSHLLFAAAASGCADNLTQRSETRLSPTAYLFSDQLDTQRKASFASCFLAAELFWEGFCILLSCSSTININLSEINRAGWGCRDANSLCNTTLIQFRCCWESLCVSSLSFNPRSASVWYTVFSRLVWGQLLSPSLPVCFLFQIQEEKSADVSVFLVPSFNFSPSLSLPLPFIFLERQQSTQPPLENAFLCTLSSTAVSTNEADKTLCAADHRSRFMSMRRIFPHEISTCPFKSPPLCNSAGLRHVFSPAPGSSQRHVEQHQQEEDGGRGERYSHRHIQHDWQCWISVGLFIGVLCVT